MGIMSDLSEEIDEKNDRIAELEAELSKRVPFEVFQPCCENKNCEHYIYESNMYWCHNDTAETCPLTKEV